MTEMKTRQQIRAEKRRSRKTRNLFETGLEALEVPTAVLQIGFTTTEALLFQVLLLNSDRKSGRIHRAKVKNYIEWTGVKSRSSIYAALAGLNEKGLIETETDGWVTGTVVMRFQNRSDDAQQLIPGMPLARALVHRQALKLMIAYRLAPLTIRLYWKLASDLDLQTGKLHIQKISELAKLFNCKKASIYKAIRQIRDAGLGSLIVDYGVEGHLEHVSLAYGVIRLAVERKIEEAKHGKSYAQKFEHYRVALYQLFGIPIEALSPAEIQKGITKLREKLEQMAPWEERTAVARE